jgi:DNA-binding CsgD family transcriptional regulator
VPQDERLCSLLDQVYRAAGDNAGWKCFLENLSQIFPAASASLVLFDPEQKHYGVDVNVGMPEEALALYNSHYVAIDSWYLRARGRVQENWVGDGRTLCPTEDLKRTEFFNDFIRRYGWEHECAAVLETRGSAMAVLAMMRRAKDEEFSAFDLALIRALIPHLQRALELHRRIVDIRAKSGMQAWALDQLPLGIVLLGGAGKVLLANRAARVICVPRNGLSLSTNGLHASMASEDRRLQALVRSAAAPQLLSPAGGFMSVTRPWGNPLRLQIAPFPNADSLGAAAGVAIFISDPDRKPASSTAVLSSLFGLTSAEARLALGLAEDKSLTELAEEFRVSYGTVRSQLKSIFQKTNTSRQAQLVRLLLLLPTRY